MREVLGFYGRDGSYGGFSNFYPADFDVNGLTFHWSEQFIMYQKAVLFNDMQMATNILRADSPQSCKRLGRAVMWFDGVIWETSCEDLVLPGLYAKFSQNEHLKRLLLGTGDMILAECSPSDTIWGIGMGLSNPNVQNPSLWRGRNRQGNLLMVVRRQLREEMCK